MRPDRFRRRNKGFVRSRDAPCVTMGMKSVEGPVPVKINGVLPNSMDGVVRGVLRRALDPRPEAFVVHISRPHSDLVVHVQQPFDKRLKFSGAGESEIARELYTTVTEIAEGELGPVATGKKGGP